MEHIGANASDRSLIKRFPRIYHFSFFWGVVLGPISLKLVFFWTSPPLLLHKLFKCKKELNPIVCFLERQSVWFSERQWGFDCFSWVAVQFKLFVCSFGADRKTKAEAPKKVGSNRWSVVCFLFLRSGIAEKTWFQSMLMVWWSSWPWTLWTLFLWWWWSWWRWRSWWRWNW